MSVFSILRKWQKLLDSKFYWYNVSNEIFKLHIITCISLYCSKMKTITNTMMKNNIQQMVFIPFLAKTPPPFSKEWKILCWTLKKKSLSFEHYAISYLDQSFIYYKFVAGLVEYASLLGTILQCTKQIIIICWSVLRLISILHMPANSAYLFFN